MKVLRWWRVDDETEGRVRLVQAESAQDACQVYFREYGPDLYVRMAEDEEVAAWPAVQEDGGWVI